MYCCHRFHALPTSASCHHQLPHLGRQLSQAIRSEHDDTAVAARKSSLFPESEVPPMPLYHNLKGCHQGQGGSHVRQRNAALYSTSNWNEVSRSWCRWCTDSHQTRRICRQETGNDIATTAFSYPDISLGTKSGHKVNIGIFCCVRCLRVELFIVMESCVMAMATTLFHQLCTTSSPWWIQEALLVIQAR